VAARLNSTLQPRTKHVHVSDTDKPQNIITDANFDFHAQLEAIMSHPFENTYITLSQVVRSSGFKQNV
jgi:sugar phosphate isomerase/epimerase